MVISFNPFAGLIETSAYPHARAHRTSLKQKCRDTFKIFFGYFYSNDLKNSHVGIFDYLPLLGIVPLLQKAHVYFIHRDGKESNAAIAIGGFIAAIQLLFALPRIIFAAVLTFVCIIPVCIVHGLMSDGKLKKEINDFIPNSTENTLAKLLESKNTCLEEICDVKTTPHLDKPTIQTLQFFAPTAQRPSAAENEDHLLLEEPTEVAEDKTQHKVLQFDLDTTTHASFFQALKELNVGGVQSKQEAEGKQEYWI